MENNIEKGEKLEVKSLRLSPSVDAKIKELAGDYGNVNAFIEYLLTLNEKENNAIKYPDFKANIEAFSVLLSKLDRAYMSVVEVGANAAQFAREEVSKEMESQRQTISDLQEKNKGLSNSLELAKSQLTMAETAKGIAQMENETLTNINKKNDDLIESLKKEIAKLREDLEQQEMFKNENEQLKEEINSMMEDQQALIDHNKSLEIESKELHSTVAGLKTQEEMLKNNIAELNIEMKVYKGTAKELEKEHKLEIKELEKVHKEDIKRLNEEFNAKLEREIERVTTSAAKEVELQNREFKLKEEQLKFNIEKLQEKLNETSIILNATSQELKQIKAKNKQKGKAE